MFHQKNSYSLAEINHSIKSSAHSLDSSTLNSHDYSSIDTICKDKPSAKHNPFLVYFYTILTSVMFSVSSMFVKKLTYIDPGHLSLVRNVAVFFGCLPIAIYSVANVLGPKQDRFMLFVRGLIGATAVYLNLTAYRYLPFAEAAVVMSTTPVVTTVAAHLFLKESCGRVQVFGLLITFCGVLLSVRLPELLSERGATHFDSDYIKGLASGVACVILFSALYVTLRKMKGFHFSVPLIYIGFFGAVENGVINLSSSPFVFPNCGTDQIFVLLIGIFGFIGNCTLTLAVKVEAVGIVSVIKASLDIVVAMILQILFINNDFDKYNIIGACLVMLSVSMIGLNKWLHMLPEESKARKRFKYLL